MKPKKPYPDFPLTPHPSGRWCKKVRGKLHYFGPWDDPYGALNLWLDQKDLLYAGKPLRASQEPTVDILVNGFLTRSKRRTEQGSLSPQSYNDYFRIGKIMIEVLGRHTPLDGLGPLHFAKLQEHFAKSSPVVQIRQITTVRMILRWGKGMGLPAIDTGPDFRPPSKKAVRLAKASKPKKLLSKDEILRSLPVA